MSLRDLETDPQGVAADPGINAFVTANAGSGKTKTLIDRVARLLLAGSRPAAILCVTYTKAAAAEMQRRLFGLLGRWAVLDDAALRGELARLEGRPADSFDAAALSRARALFAGALETPGGLKIQTIHAFCEALLRRFPLEAGIAPGFSVMDDAQAGAIAKAARGAVAMYAGAEGKGQGGLIADAYARMSVALDFAAFQSMFAAFEGKRGALAAYFERVGEAMPDDVWRRCGFTEASSAQDEAAAVMGRLDRPLWRQAAEVLNAGGVTDQKNAVLLLAVAADPEATFDQACRPLFTEGGAGSPATWVAKTSGLKSREDLRARMLEQQALLEAGRERIAAARVAEDTVMALSLAKAHVVAYQAEKKARAALDFADLIERTEDLLTRRADAAWVLYKLDGGIDHLLLDEAQDTAPEQWAIIRALTEEFFAGAGVDSKLRTLFVVGDEKQSIYSFQGADPARFLSETARYRSEIRAAGLEAELVPLTTSYRSTREVLSFVDAVFEAEDTRAAVPPPAEQERVAHSPFRVDGRGCVDLWPLVREPEKPVREAWDAPVDQRGEMSADRQLAERIAAEIAALVARGDAVFDPAARQWRPATFGDVLILVRRRGALFEEILRALKRAGAPVAGADRLQLSAHIVFDDLLALARFCLFPDDDLTLAGLLKSPFVGLDDDALYALARPRGRASLWAALRRRADEQPLWRAAADFLVWAQAESRRMAPFELFARALDRLDGEGRSMRQRFLTRLGAEAADALAEFLSQTAAAEQRGVRDLESLAAALAGLDIVVKREMDEARGEVRVMTTHGSKGLEAPIVILPEITFGGGGRGSPLLDHRDDRLGDGFLWCAAKTGDCGASRAAREARAEAEAAESLRLLYVALTRARDRLILCGRIAATARIENLKGWHRNLTAAFAAQGVAPHLRRMPTGDDEFTRFGDDPVTLGAAAVSSAPPVEIPAWTCESPPPENPAWRYAQPSRAAEAEHGPSPSPLAQAGGLGRYRRGEIIHRLLQLLPDVAPDQRADAARRLLASEPLEERQRAEMIAAALGVLEDPAFAAVFAPGSRAEAAIAGTAPQLPSGLRISGRVDRLSVTPDRVLVVDFKTNRPAPARIEQADGAYLTQMALYWAVLGRLFPGRAVEAALVWTDGPKLMPVPEELLAKALQSLGSYIDR